MDKKQLPKRKEIRLSNYDYSTSVYYFVTIVTQQREMMFGNIIDGKMMVNEAEEMVEKFWKLLPQRFQIDLDIFQIMPNHFHGIVIINN